MVVKNGDLTKVNFRKKHHQQKQIQVDGVKFVWKELGPMAHGHLKI